MTNALIPWGDYSLRSLVSALNLGDGSDRTLPEINIDTCLLALVLSGLGWDGELVDRNLCIPSGPPPDSSYSFKVLRWKGEAINAVGQSFEEIRAQLPASVMAGFAGPGKQIPLADCEGLLLLESCQDMRALFQERLLVLALKHDPEIAAAPTPRSNARL